MHRLLRKQIERHYSAFLDARKFVEYRDEAYVKLLGNLVALYHSPSFLLKFVLERDGVSVEAAPLGSSVRSDWVNIHNAIAMLTGAVVADVEKPEELARLMDSEFERLKELLSAANDDERQRVVDFAERKLLAAYRTTDEEPQPKTDATPGWWEFWKRRR